MIGSPTVRVRQPRSRRLWARLRLPSLSNSATRPGAEPRLPVVFLYWIVPNSRSYSIVEQAAESFPKHRSETLAPLRPAMPSPPRSVGFRGHYEANPLT